MGRMLFLLPAVLGSYVVVSGCLTLVGWIADVPRLADWDGDQISMQPNAGLAAVATGLALTLAMLRQRTLAVLLAVVPLFVGGVTLIEHVTDWDLGIDRLLLFDRPWGTRLTITPGRMGVPGSLSWMMAGIALVLLLRRPSKTHVAVPAIGILLIVVATLSMTGYLFGADMLFALPRLTAIAFQTATTLLAVGAALIALASDRPPMRVLIEDSTAGALARLALPVVILLPLVIGYLCVRGQQAGLFDPLMGYALLVLLLIAALCTVLWWTTHVVSSREHSLRRIEERFSRFMLHLPGLAWIKDAEGRYLYVNDAAARAFRWPREQLYGKTDSELFPAETAAQFRANDRQALETGRGVQVVETLKQDDGVCHHSIVSKFPIHGDETAPLLVGGMAIDITERKRAEETVRSLLQLSERLNSSLDVDSLLDMLVREAIALVGAESGVSGVLTPEGLVCQRYLQKGEVLPLEYCWPPLHGLPGWLIVHKRPYLTNDAQQDTQIVQSLCAQFGVWSALSTPILSADGKLLAFFEIHNKIDGTGFTSSDQELLVAVSQVAAIAVQNALAYRALAEAKESLRESDRRKDEFLAVLAHELRNPLAPIRTGLEIIKQSCGKDEVLSEAQQAMDRQLAHLVRLVDDLLDVSRISRDRLQLRTERVELAAVIRQAVETSQPLAQSENQSIELNLPEDAMYLLADGVRLAQVFSNLLNDACKFSRANGVIRVAARRDGSDAVISIKDDGIGIPPDKLGQVFEMFTQVHQSFERTHRGLGVGLTLVKRLVEMHGGDVSAHSAGEGTGSEFVVRLPIIVDAPGPSECPKEQPADAIQRRRVLIVDDNYDAATMLSTLMRLTGHETALAHDGEEACTVAESYRPDIILLDIGLPKMSGYEVCRLIRQKPWGSDAIIIALTGWGQDDDRRQSCAAGFDRHLVKPVDHAQLIETLASLMPVSA